MLGECGEGGHMSLGGLHLELCEAGCSVRLGNTVPRPMRQRPVIPTSVPPGIQPPPGKSPGILLLVTEKNPINTSLGINVPLVHVED